MKQSAKTAELREDEAGAIQVGATDQGMVRLIVTTRSELVELDFTPEEAAEIADELRAAGDRAPRSAKAGGR